VNLNLPLKQNVPGAQPAIQTTPQLSEPPRPPGELLVSNPELATQLLFSTMILYGPTGSRKTSQIREFAKYIYEKTGKKTRLVSLDGGGWGPCQDLINVGVIEPWRLVEEENPKVALTKASMGGWPDRLQNGLRTSSTMTIPRREARAAALKDVGAYAVEGFYSIAQAIIRDVVKKGQKISEDIVSKFEEQTEYGSEQYGAPARAHYGFVQNYILDMIRNFSSLPVERILYTSLEGKGEDKLTKALQYGPAVAGQALTASIPQFVGDCIHLEDYNAQLKVTDQANPSQKFIDQRIRFWFTSHPDPQTGVIWPAKPRLIPAMVAEFKKRLGENGCFDLTLEQHLGTYLRTQDELLLRSTDDARKWKEEADARRKQAQEAKVA
jgi:hypothetical protein